VRRRERRQRGHRRPDTPFRRASSRKSCGQSTTVITDLGTKEGKEKWGRSKEPHNFGLNKLKLEISFRGYEDPRPLDLRIPFSQLAQTSLTFKNTWRDSKGSTAILERNDSTPSIHDHVHEYPGSIAIYEVRRLSMECSSSVQILNFQLWTWERRIRQQTSKFVQAVSTTDYRCGSVF
jgi:hypothetical protein